MGDALAGDVPLDSASIQIFPNQNRYEAFVCREEQVEKVAGGLLEYLLPHLPGINDLCAKGLDASFELKSPKNLHDVEWFTKATVKRFLDVVGSPDLIDTINAIINEMSQLEDSKNFHLSLYGKDQKHHPEGEEKDGHSSTDMTPSSEVQVNTTASDASKNELLRAMDLRFSALSKELATTFNKATNSTSSPKDISDLAEFCQQFAATNIGNSLSKLIELNQKSQDVGPLHNEPAFSSCNATDDSTRVVKNSQISKPVHQETPVKYGVSPAKVAQIERQSSSESEESSHSSDEGQASAERSRSLTRSATPRRSASPMRRIQIGRTGPRRAAALTIKSLNFIPARERATSYRDAATNGSEEEISEKSYKKPEIDVRRITVQDAINLFESKQRDHATDIQTRRSMTDASINTNKSVLRRWSSGMGENSIQCQPQNDSEDSVSATSNDMADVKNPKSVEGEVVSDFVSESHNYNEVTENNVKPEREENIRSNTVDNQAETNPDLGKETRKWAASAEWNQQKQAEYNEILMKMMESKSVKFGKSQPSKNQNIPSEQRGGSYDDYKEKRDAKLQGGNTSKKVEKEAQFRAVQQILDKKKAEMLSNSGNGTKKNTTRKPQKSLRNPTQPANSSKEASKPAVTKKVSSKASPLPATRKSWSATPSPRVAATSPAKVRGGVSSASTTPTRRKPQSAASVPQPSPQKERTQPRIRKEKETQTNNVRSLKSKNEKQQAAISNKSKEMKEKVTSASLDSSTPSKISLTNKGTKKSSVVPVESKPFLRKGSRTGHSTAITSKKKISPKPEESPRDNGVPIEAQETDLVANTSDLLSQHSDRDSVTPNNQNAVLEPECQINNHLQSGETDNVDEVPTEVGDVSTNVEWSSLKMNTEEESTIPPTAWEEIEEHLELPKTCEDGSFQPASPANIVPAGLASPRVRHSLSQMLQEESSEPDTCEWGNAENPPAMIYQKDAPKGLKRLLKFARKSKGDTNSTGWSSPSVFSEGEDDAEESKNGTKRNAENLLRKAALHAKSYGQPKSSLHEGYDKNLALSKLDGKVPHKMQGGRDFGAGPTTKGSRSFFSLSAFRGGKPAEAKFH
ncbi:nucleolar protein dao-5 isoform X2 [Neltuma alba]|uniref:nucleolar protein dao-5 isoform X2 n=1 Tax=Neltuma alba TaxID=207710 RepID=UPI0010A34D39|nr:nucleolar protein dao-5-like isoform X2 [Prosopis alba]